MIEQDLIQRELPNAASDRLGFWRHDLQQPLEEQLPLRAFGIPKIADTISLVSLRMLALPRGRDPRTILVRDTSTHTNRPCPFSGTARWRELGLSRPMKRKKRFCHTQSVQGMLIDDS
jgi:hypothetical protein